MRDKIKRNYSKSDFGIYKITSFLYKRAIEPRSKDEDQKRREFILNIILLGSIVLCSIASFFSFSRYIALGPEHKGFSPLIPFLVFLIFLFLLFLSRKGFFNFSTYVLIVIFLIPTIYAVFLWGIWVPQALLVYALLIIISGILVNTRFAFVVTSVISFIMIMYIYLLEKEIIHPNLSWKGEKEKIDDALIFIFTFGVIFLVSWLSNREIRKSLARARRSEKTLQKERDLLDLKVKQKTIEVKRAQMEKMQQLYRFAEFGRLASGLFHDLANPLTAVSLGVNRMEKFVQAARSQIQKREKNVTFSLSTEIKYAVTMLSHKAKKQGIQIIFSQTVPVKIHGDQIKFNQLITNLISNAIDAYKGVRREDAKVLIKIAKKEKMIYLEVQDWGKGIAPENIDKIFEPFFTTKKASTGTGIGLFTCRNIVGRDLKGKIKVKSKEGEGSVFEVEFPLQKEKIKLKT